MHLIIFALLLLPCIVYGQMFPPGVTLAERARWDASASVATNAAAQVDAITNSIVSLSNQVVVLSTNSLLITDYIIADPTTNYTLRTSQISSNLSYTEGLSILLTSKVDQAAYDTSDNKTNYMQRDIQISSNSTYTDVIVIIQTGKVSQATYDLAASTTNFTPRDSQISSNQAYTDALAVLQTSKVSQAAYDLAATTTNSMPMNTQISSNLAYTEAIGTLQTGKVDLATYNASEVATNRMPLNTQISSNLAYTEAIATLNTGKVSQSVYDLAETTTNRVAKTGDTVSGAIISIASTALSGPANNELVTGGWVRGLFESGSYWYFANTTSVVNSIYGNFVGETQAVIFSKIVASVTNTQYAISAMTTQRFLRVQGPMFANAWIRQIDNGAGNSLSCHPEFYYTYDGTNLFGDYETPPKTISTANTTNFYDWVVAFPTIESTNTEGFYVVARMKIDVANNSGIEIVGGSNRLSAIGFSVPAQTDDPTKLDSNVWAIAGSTTNAMPMNTQIASNLAYTGAISILNTGKVSQAVYDLAASTTNAMPMNTQISSNSTLQANINGKLALTGGTVTGTFATLNTSFNSLTNGNYWIYNGTTQAIYRTYVGTNFFDITFNQ